VRPTPRLSSLKRYTTAFPSSSFFHTCSTVDRYPYHFFDRAVTSANSHANPLSHIVRMALAIKTAGSLTRLSDVQLGLLSYNLTSHVNIVSILYNFFYFLFFKIVYFQTYRKFFQFIYKKKHKYFKYIKSSYFFINTIKKSYKKYILFK
jgi:hypothetical protein